MIDVETLIADLPDPEGARRFLASLEELHPSQANKLRKNDGLLSDALTLAAYSPLLATTLLQNPDYIWWLNRKRRAASVRTKDELMEALGRFVLTHSQLDLHAQLARFRRRELLRIFLGDIRRLTTMAEITEDISNLADATLETALRAARQEMDNRFGPPMVADSSGKKKAAEFSVVSLGKLGSRELNYSSDIDLLFLYSAEGETTGRGSRGSVTNREYFVKLSETITQIVGQHKGEGAAYRVDMRLRPHGRVGPLAISVADAVRYYTTEARDWERQVLIRSRSSAGDADVYKHFFEQVEDVVFSSEANSPPGLRRGADASAAGWSADGVVLSDPATPTPRITKALESVRLSKQLIDREQRTDRGFNVKLGRGGVREIEFISQALQLAYGGDDRWLRAPHTLISLARLSDRDLISEAELTELFDAYEFLRHAEHVLQMENGLQTHTVPEEPDRRALVARRMRCENVAAFDDEIVKHTENVHRVFGRVFGSSAEVEPSESADDEEREPDPIVVETDPPRPHAGGTAFDRQYYVGHFQTDQAPDFRHRLGAFRRRWSQLLHEIRDSELDNEIDMPKAKRAQTALAEASIETALEITRSELAVRYKTDIKNLPMAVMGLGKLGGGAIDYESDLDLVLVYAADQPVAGGVTHAEFYGRAAEIFVTALSSMTRDGSIYRVDLRLRPYGKNGQSAISAMAFTDYMRDSASIWEWLAYVKIRGVGGDLELARKVEADVRAVIHARANETDQRELAEETRRVRLLLEKEKAGRWRRQKEVDIKYGPGGMLDVYFAMRFLQLRDNIPDVADNRSTEYMLGVLCETGSITTPDSEAIVTGYRFLSALDHNLRLTVGRTTRLPTANVKAMETVAKRMNLASALDLVEQLTVHRLNVRAAFDNIVK